MQRLRVYGVELALVLTLALAVAYFGYLAWGLLPNDGVDERFDGRRALATVERQLAFGSRTTGTQSSINMGNWLVQQLTGMGWDVVVQEFVVNEPLKVRNIIAIRTPQSPSPNVAMLVTPYDSRLAADADLNEAARAQPAPGANAGASGTALLLELARTLDVESGGNTVCLAFLDAEANGGIPGWAPFVGSNQLAHSLSRDVLRCASPSLVVALNEVGAAGAHFQPDPAATPWINDALWKLAAELGFSETFVAQPAAFARAASHTAFAEVGYDVGLIMDSAPSLAGTLADTAGRLSAETLGRVGQLLESWLEKGAPRPETPAAGATSSARMALASRPP